MGDREERDGRPDGAGGADEPNPSIPASEEGTGIVPEDEGDSESNTHLPASEEDSGLIEREDDLPVQSWPGSGQGGSIPPPG